MIARVGNTRGVSLIEVMIALTILSIVLVALGGLMFQVARHAQTSAIATYRAAAAQQGASWIGTLPWDSLDNVVGCTSDSSGQLEYNRCVSLQNVTPRVKRVTLVIAPTGILTAPPETTLVLRNRPRAPSPLK